MTLFTTKLYSQRIRIDGIKSVKEQGRQNSEFTTDEQIALILSISPGRRLTSIAVIRVCHDPIHEIRDPSVDGLLALFAAIPQSVANQAHLDPVNDERTTTVTL